MIEFIKKYLFGFGPSSGLMDENFSGLTKNKFSGSGRVRALKLKMFRVRVGFGSGKSETRPSLILTSITEQIMEKIAIVIYQGSLLKEEDI